MTMKNKQLNALWLSATLLVCAASVQAQTMPSKDMAGYETHMNHKGMGHEMSHSMHGHGPIGVMGRHLMPKGGLDATLVLLALLLI